MNKQSMWFLTLFTLILVLSVYYITMPNELLLTNNSNYSETTISQIESENTTSSEDDIEVTIESSEEIVALRVSHEDEIQENISKLEAVMMSEDALTEEKNEAYEQIQYLTTLQGKEEKIEEKLKTTYKVDNFVSIDNSSVSVVIAKDEHDVNLANSIMKTVQEEFGKKMYITVKFASN